MRELFSKPHNRIKAKRHAAFSALILVAVLMLFTACGGSSSAEYKHLEPDEAETMMRFAFCTAL